MAATDPPLPLTRGNPLSPRPGKAFGKRALLGNQHRHVSYRLKSATEGAGRRVTTVGRLRRFGVLTESRPCNRWGWGDDQRCGKSRRPARLNTLRSFPGTVIRARNNVSAGARRTTGDAQMLPFRYAAANGRSVTTADQTGRIGYFRDRPRAVQTDQTLDSGQDRRFQSSQLSRYLANVICTASVGLTQKTDLQHIIRL